MTAQDLVFNLLEHSERLHANWTKEQHFIWISGMLAEVAVEKNHNDNIVFQRLKDRINRLHATK